MPRGMDEIRLEMRRLVAMRNEHKEGSDAWFDVQDHISTLLWVVGALDEAPSTWIKKNEELKNS